MNRYFESPQDVFQIGLLAPGATLDVVRSEARPVENDVIQSEGEGGEVSAQAEVLSIPRGAATVEYRLVKGEIVLSSLHLGNHEGQVISSVEIDTEDGEHPLITVTGFPWAGLVSRYDLPAIRVTAKRLAQKVGFTISGGDYSLTSTRLAATAQERFAPNGDGTDIAAAAIYGAVLEIEGEGVVREGEPVIAFDDPATQTRDGLTENGQYQQWTSGAFAGVAALETATEE